MKSTAVREAYKTLHQIVLEELRDDIVKGVYPPGYKLNEPELAARYGVSRGPVREALRLLSGQGLVRVVTGKGATVTRLTRSEIAEIYDIRIELEGLAARLGVRHIDDQDVRKMKVLLDRMGASLDTPLTYVSLNDEFHMTLYKASGRAQLCEIISELMTRTLPYVHRYVSSPEILAKVHREHTPLYEAVAARDEVQAEAITRRHLSPGSDEMLDLIDEPEREPATEGH